MNWNPADLERQIPQRALDAMIQLVLAWAHLDAGLSIWVGVRFGMRPDRAAILLGRADIPSKLRRLQVLYPDNQKRV